MTIASTIRPVIQVTGLMMTLLICGPMASHAIAAEMSTYDEDDSGSEMDNGNSEDHANDNANVRATGEEDECGTTIENSRC